MATKKSKRFIQVALLVSTVVSLFFVPWPIVFAWLKPLPDSIQQQVDAATDYGFEGIIVCVDQAQNEAQFYTAGYHNRAQKISARPNALFKIASVGKLYDAVAITKLVNDDQLDLNETLANYFPELANRIENADEITLKMLVQHRSGIPNYTNVPNFWMNPPETNQETLELVLDQPANFSPGEDYEYSNTNYLLLTELIEKTVGYSKFQYIKEEERKKFDGQSNALAYLLTREFNGQPLLTDITVGGTIPRLEKRFKQPSYLPQELRDRVHIAPIGDRVIVPWMVNACDLQAGLLPTFKDEVILKPPLNTHTGRSQGVIRQARSLGRG